MSHWAGLTSIVVLFVQAGDVRTPHKEDGVDGHGPGRGVSGTPRGFQGHLEMDPGLAQCDETDDYYAQHAQRQAQLAADLLGFMQHLRAYGQL